MKKVFLVVLLGAVLSGCQSMEAASLVYTSSHSIGVNVESGTPQNPGLIVSAGYRGHNAAYVPVLAAKHCDDPTYKTCADGIYKAYDIQSMDSVSKERFSAEKTRAEIAEKLDGTNSPKSESQEANGNNSMDAFSVFGSFDGGANGGSDGGGILAGQLFSTGLAAQFLTENYGEAASLKAASECVNSVTKATSLSGTELAEVLKAVCAQPNN
jgi:hypothetical protein